MKKNILALAVTTAVLSFAMPEGVRAEDQKPTSGEDGGCSGGSCHKGDKKKDADKGDKPAPAPSPAQ